MLGFITTAVEGARKLIRSRPQLFATVAAQFNYYYKDLVVLNLGTAAKCVNLCSFDAW